MPRLTIEQMRKVKNDAFIAEVAKCQESGKYPARTEEMDAMMGRCLEALAAAVLERVLDEAINAGEHAIEVCHAIACRHLEAYRKGEP